MKMRFAWFPDDPRFDRGFVFDADESTGVPAAVLSVVSLGALGGLMFFFAARRLRTPAATER